MEWDDGRYYKGGFLDGIQHGKGIYRNIKGQLIEGVWDKGRLLNDDL